MYCIFVFFGNVSSLGLGLLQVVMLGTFQRVPFGEYVSIQLGMELLGHISLLICKYIFHIEKWKKKKKQCSAKQIT